MSPKLKSLIAKLKSFISKAEFLIAKLKSLIVLLPVSARAVDGAAASATPVASVNIAATREREEKWYAVMVGSFVCGSRPRNTPNSVPGGGAGSHAGDRGFSR